MTKLTREGFTLIEILLVVAIIAVVGAITVVFLNPVTQIERARDAKIKTDLNALKKSLEDWYNDKKCYPKPSQICYDSVGEEVNPCHICGTEANSPSFAPYLSQLPCHSSHPAEDHVYSVDNTDCPQSYRIYTNLNYDEDQNSKNVGCYLGSCGPKPNYGYNYGISSPNVSLEHSYYVCRSTQNQCDGCGPEYQDCGVSCVVIYPSLNACCTANPGICTKWYCILTSDSSCGYCGWSASSCYSSNLCKSGTIRSNPDCN